MYCRTLSAYSRGSFCSSSDGKYIGSSQIVAECRNELMTRCMCLGARIVSHDRAGLPLCCGYLNKTGCTGTPATNAPVRKGRMYFPLVVVPCKHEPGASGKNQSRLPEWHDLAHM